MDFLPESTEEQIALFEKEHEVTLPLKYKEWLQYSDGGECFLPASVQFYGVAANQHFICPFFRMREGA